MVDQTRQFNANLLVSPFEVSSLLEITVYWQFQGGTDQHNIMDAPYVIWCSVLQGNKVSAQEGRVPLSCWAMMNAKICQVLHKRSAFARLNMSARASPSKNSRTGAAPAVFSSTAALHAVSESFDAQS